MKKILKKAIAVIEVVAMSVTLMAGLSFGITQEVKAAKDGALTVNEEITVSSENGESKSYTFVAPKDGTYYFTTTGEYDMYGELYIGRELCGENDDDGEGANFLITQTLTEGQECTIKFYEYGYFPFTINLLVYDDTYGKDEVARFGTNNGPVIYCYLGNSVTFNILAYDMLGQETEVDLDIYSFKWYKAKSSDESDETISEKTELGATGLSYTVDKVEATDFYDQDDDITRYYVEIYKGGECIDTISFFLHNKAEYMTVGGGSYTLIKGESVTFEPTARGYYGNIIDLSSGDYTFKWTKVETDGDSYEETELECTESTYTISEIAETDFYEQENSYVYYKVYIYINGREKYSAYFYIYDNVDYFSAVGSTYALLEGDSVTLTPAAYDHNEELIDMSGSEYTFEWYKVKSGDGVYEETDLENTGLNYEISSIESLDFYEQDGYNVYYRADIYKDEQFKDSSYFYIYEYDESTTTEPETTEDATTTVVETTTTVVETTTEEITTTEPQVETTQQATTASPATTEEQTTTASTEQQPIEVVGFVIQSVDGNKVTFVWGQNQEQMDLGQKYNVYIDGNYYQTYDAAQSVEYTFETVGEHTILIKAVLNGVESSGVSQSVSIETSEVTTQEETTTQVETTTQEETTVADDSKIVISDDVKIEGYQISQLSWGFRTISSVEPEIDGKEVVEYGNIYGILRGYVSADDLYVGNDNKYVASFKATEEGTADKQFSDSATAINYVRTMSENGSNSEAFQQRYMIRAYAKLSDGSYVYSNAYEYSIYDVAKVVYSQGMMPNITSHNYVYENILKVVDSNYAEVDYNWSGGVVTP